jgi:hypothetical protein
MQNTTLAFYNFNIKQYENFSAILTLSVMSLNDNWTLVDEDNARVIFVASEYALTQMQWDGLQTKYPEAILIAYSDNLKSLEVEKQLLTPLTKLPSRASLIILLNEVALELNQLDIESNKIIEEEAYDLIDIIVDDEAVKHAESRYFLPQDYFLGLVLSSIEEEQAYECKSQNGVLIYIYPQHEKYFYSVEKKALKSLFLMSPENFTLTKLTALEIEQRTHTMMFEALNDLLWRATITASQGRLMKGLSFNDVIHLRHWPDISHIKMVNNYLIIAAFMTRNTVDLNTIIKHTEQELADVVDFHNGCHILGLIGHDQTFSLNSKPVSDKLRQLRERIFETLRLNVVDK